MKFRALNLDYHGEATLHWAEEETEWRPKGEKSQACILLRKDCYEKDAGEMMDSSQLELTTGLPMVEKRNVDTVASKYALESFMGIPSTKATDTCWDKNCFDCTSSELDYLMPLVLPCNYAKDKSKPVSDTQRSMDLYKSISCKADAKHTHCLASLANELSNAVPMYTNAKAEYQPPLLSCAELQNFLHRLYSISNTVRLANEPWHGRLPKHFRLRLFWREPKDFLPVNCSNQEEYCTLFQNRSSLCLSRVSKRIKTIADTLGRQLQVVEGLGYASHAQSSFSFKLLEMLRGGAGTFGPRRVKKASCRHQLAAERGTIVPYIGPITRRTPETKISPPPDLILAMQIVVAMMRQQNHVVSRNEADDNGDTNVTDAVDSINNAENAQDKVSSDGGCVHSTDHIEKHKKRPRDSALLFPSRGRSNSTMQVSFANSPTDRESKKARFETAPTSGQCTTSSSTEQTCKTQPEASVSSDEPVKIDQKSAKAKEKKKRTAEEKAERRKQKQERKARKQEKSHEEKRKCSGSADSNFRQQAKRLKYGVLEAECQLKTNSPKRTGILPRSVVSNKSPSRRVSVADGVCEFEKTRAVLNNIKHENRSAFSQMKLPRSTLGRSGATAMNSFEWSPNAQEHKGIRGQSQCTATVVSKPVHVPRPWHENAPADLGHYDAGQQPPTDTQALGAIAQNEGLHEFCRQLPEHRSLRAAKPFVNGIAPNLTQGSNSSLYSTAVHGRPMQQRRESAHKEIPADSARRPHQAIAPLTIGNNHFQLQATETAHGASARVHTVALELEAATPLPLPCSESFLESWSVVVAELASGRWKQHPGNGTMAFKDASGFITPGRGINLVDSPLVNACGVDIEAPGRSAILVHSVSALEAEVDAKAIVLGVATLAATGRYKSIYIFLSYDTEINTSIAKHLTQLQCATIRSNGLPETKVTIKTTSPSTLSFSLAQTILSLSARGGKTPLKNSIIEGISDSPMVERARLLLSLIPVLSASGSIETLLLAKQCLPNGSPYFRLVCPDEI